MVLTRRHWLRLALVAALILVFAGILAAPARALEFRRGDAVTIGPDEVINDDLFISASTVVMSGTVNGDLWVAGTRAEINGAVKGSLFFAGQRLDLGGDVTGSVYSGASTVTLGRQANVTRNLYFIGFALQTAPGSAVGGDLLTAGNQALVEGDVKRNLNFGGSALEINGTVGGNVEAAVAEPGGRSFVPPFPEAPAPAPPGLRVGEGARIAGRLTYTSPVEQAANIRSQPAGGVVFRPTAPPERAPDPALRWALAWFRLFVTLLALGALAIWGLGAPLGALADRVYNGAALSAGWGVLMLLAGFGAAFVAAFLILIVGALLAALTLGGLAATVLVGAGAAWAFGFAVFVLAVVYGSKIVISYLLGRLVLQRLSGVPNPEPVWILVVGVLIYSLLQSIPFIGGLIGLAATLIGLGAIYLVWRDSQAPL